jgi:hypothetical protein
MYRGSQGRNIVVKIWSFETVGSWGDKEQPHSVKQEECRYTYMWGSKNEIADSKFRNIDG